MRQTVEEAAHLFAESRSSGSAFPAYYQGFIAGAEWQSCQSPWVSVKERLPKENEMVLCRMVSNGAIVSGYIVVEAGKPPRAQHPVILSLKITEIMNVICGCLYPI